MNDNLDIDDESMRHIEALLARHRPDMIHRMFQQAMESRMSGLRGRVHVVAYPS